jgi:hypothetical protein
MTPNAVGPKRFSGFTGFFLALLLTLSAYSQPARPPLHYKFSINTSRKLVINPTTLPSATVSSLYSTTLSASGGTAPYQFSVAHSALPAGLSLNRNSGTISGTPTVAGAFSFRVYVSDAYSDRGSWTLSLNIRSSGVSAGAVTVSVSPSISSVPSSGTQQFSALVSGTSNTSVTWSASKGTISSSGTFTAPAVLTTTSAIVTATSVADATQSASATVDITPAAVSVQLSPGSTTLQSGGSQQFVATINNASNTGVTWSTSVGSVSTSGLYTAPSVATSTTATVTATSVADKTKSATATVTINPAPAVSVQIAPGSASVQSGATQQFTATVSNSSNSGVTWTASVGSISGTGLYVAPTVSTSTNAVIRATSVADTAKYGQASVTIAPVSEISSSSATSSGADNRYCGAGNVSNFGSITDTLATLPSTCFYTALAGTPSPGNTIPVNAGGNLQGAIDAANCGDTITIAAGASFTGTYTLPAKACDDQHWITIRTSAPNSSLPPEGTRLTPCYAGVSSLPDRPALNCTSTATVTARILAGGNQAFITASGANHYRLIGLEITHPAAMPTGQPDTLVALTDSTALPHHILIDRCWIHGLPTAFLKRGVKIDGNYLAVIDSTVTDVHAVGTSTQGILSGTGTGPLKIVNDFVEGGDSAVGFGGQANPFGNPADVEIRRNHLFKPWSWQAGNPDYLGYGFSTKVALESKNSDRVLIEANIMEHTWGDQSGGPSQGGDGSIAWLGPKNQESSCPTCDVSDITIRYNVVRHAGGGFYIFDSPADTGAIALQAMRYSIHDNELDDISTVYSRQGSGNGTLNRFSGTSTYAPPANVNVFHNTGLAGGAAILSLNGASVLPYVGFNFSNNLETYGSYGILGCSGLVGTNVLTSCAPGYTWSNNILIGSATGLVSPSSINFANYNNGNGGDYRLCQGPGTPASTCTAASPYANKGTDGRDIGADISTVNAMTSGVD